MQVPRFQILKCEPLSILCKLLELSWLYIYLNVYTVNKFYWSSIILVIFDFQTFLSSGIHFSGWKTENIVGNEFTAENSRIIVVQSNDQSSHWAKVSKSILYSCNTFQFLHFLNHQHSTVSTRVLKVSRSRNMKQKVYEISTSPKIQSSGFILNNCIN